MTFVVTRLCIDCVDTSCAAVCPVDCFYQPKEVSEKYPNQLYISPEECIDCAVCEPECPWDAIYADEDVPDVFSEDTALNAASDDDRDAFVLAEVVELAPPSPEQVEENKRKWGFV